MSKRHARKGSPVASPETERNVMGTPVGLGAVAPRGGFGVNVTVGGKAFEYACPLGYIRLKKLETAIASYGYKAIVCAAGCPDDGKLSMQDVVSFVAQIGDKTFYDDEPALAYAKQTGLTARIVIACGPGPSTLVPANWGEPTHQLIGFEILGTCEPIELYVAKNVVMAIGSQKLGPGSVIDHSYWQAKQIGWTGTGIPAWDAVVAPGHSLVLLPSGQYGGVFPLGEGASLASYTTAQCASGGGGSTCPPGMYKLLGKCVKSAGGYAFPGAPGSAPSGRGVGAIELSIPSACVPTEIRVAPGMKLTFRCAARSQPRRSLFPETVVLQAGSVIPHVLWRAKMVSTGIWDAVPTSTCYAVSSADPDQPGDDTALTVFSLLDVAYVTACASLPSIGLQGLYGTPEEIGIDAYFGLGAPNNLPTWPPCSNGEVRDFQGMCVPPGSIYPPCMPTTASARGSMTVHVAVRKGADPLPDTTYAPGSFLPHHAWQAKLVDLGGGIQGWAAVVAAGHTVHIFSASLGSLYIQPGGHLNPYLTLFCGDSLRGGGQGIHGTGLGCPSDTQVQGNCPDGYYFCTHDNVCKRRSSSEAFG